MLDCQIFSDFISSLYHVCAVQWWVFSTVGVILSGVEGGLEYSGDIQYSGDQGGG